MPIDFHYFVCSPPCRSVILLAKAIGVHLNLKTTCPAKGDLTKSGFAKNYSQYEIPKIDDGGFILSKSPPIMGYLVNKYAKNDSLYPKDPRKRGIVDQMLYFDTGMLSENIIKCYYSVVFFGAHSVNEGDVQAVEKSCEFLNTFLDGREFAAGDSMTIADFAISTTISVLLCFGFDIGRYDNVAAWYNRCKQALDKFGFEEVHAPGTKMFTELYRANLQESS